MLLSTHELLYFESDKSPKCKGVVDLREATACQKVASPDYNYEFAFEVISPKRTWVLCPDDEQSMEEWMADIQPLIKAKGKGAAKKRRNSVSQQGGRTYEVDEDGSAAAGPRAAQGRVPTGGPREPNHAPRAEEAIAHDPTHGRPHPL